MTWLRRLKEHSPTRIARIWTTFYSPIICKIESDTKLGGVNKYNIQHIGKAKLRREGRLSVAIKCSDEALQIANAHINGSNDHVVGAIPSVMDMLLELMERAFNMFPSDEDAVLMAENELEPLQLTE